MYHDPGEMNDYNLCTGLPGGFHFFLWVGGGGDRVDLGGSTVEDHYLIIYDKVVSVFVLIA